MNGSIFLVFGVLVLSLFSVPLSISADANYQENQIPIKPKIGEIRTLPLVKPDISFDRASYEPDQTVTVTVNDRYANKDPNAVDKISTVTVTGAATGQSSSFVISETGVNTGIFDRELGVAKFWAPNPPDTIKATYTYNHGDTNSGTVSVTAKVVAPAPTDTDRDGVPDEKDNCPKEAGPANNKGCPVKIERIPTPVPVPPRPVPVEPKDSDGDGVPDNEDACPREYGPANNRGCPAKEPVPAPTRDDTPPFLIVPSDIVTDATTTQGVKVAYIVTAIDDVDGELKPTCSKSSGSLFAIGTTRVDCQVIDSAGNTAKKSFNVTVKSIMPAKPILKIPSYVKNLATFWQQDQIDDTSFVGAIQYMIENEIITIPELPKTQRTQPQQKTIPEWVKTSTQFWIDGQTADKEYATSIEWLVREGIILLSTQVDQNLEDLEKVKTITESFSPGMEIQVIVTCDSGDKALGGGFSSTGGKEFFVRGSYPAGSPPTGWVIIGKNTKNSDIDVTVYAICDKWIGPLNQEIPIYVNTKTESVGPTLKKVEASCNDADDQLLSGGFLSTGGLISVFQNMRGDLDSEKVPNSGAFDYTTKYGTDRFWHVGAKNANPGVADVTSYVICMDMSNPILVGNYYLGSGGIDYQPGFGTLSQPQNLHEIEVNCPSGTFALSPGYVSSDTSVVGFPRTAKVSEEITFHGSYPIGTNSEGWVIEFYDNLPGYDDVVIYYSCKGVPQNSVSVIPEANSRTVEVIGTTTFGLSANVPYGDLTFYIVDQPAHGTLEEKPIPPFGNQPTSSKYYSYTPQLGFVGEDSFTFIVKSASLWSNLATVSLTVNATPEIVNYEPDLSSATMIFDEDITWQPLYPQIPEQSIFVILPGVTFDNERLTYNEGTIINYGTLNNLKYIRNLGVIENYGALHNSGSLSNEGDGVINFYCGGYWTNNGVFESYNGNEINNLCDVTSP